MNTIKKIISITAILVANSLIAQEIETPATPATPETATHNHTTASPDSHAPIGVMGDHTHKKGEIMFSYRAMLMSMDGLLNGTDDVSRTETGYNINPETMNMQMHMLGAMYAPTDRITLTVMFNYLSNSMDLHNNTMDVDFTTASSGLGDIKLGVLLNVLDMNNHKVLANAALSFPSGDIETRDDTPVGDDSILGYNMHLGSGTIDPSMGATYTGRKGLFGWGAQSMFTFRVGTNDKGYGLGEKAEATAWGSVKAADFISFSTRLKYTYWGGITGSHSDVMPMMVGMMPLFDANNSGRKQLDLIFGSNLIIKAVNGLRVGLEVGLPVYQDVIGVQMKNKVAGTIGIQYAL